MAKTPKKAKAAPPKSIGNTPANAIARLEDDKQYQLAMSLFAQHTTLADISRAVGVSTTTIKAWRDKGGWLNAREDDERSILETAFGARKVTVGKLLRATADQLLRGVEHIQTRPEPPNLDESLKLSTILANLDKIARLDAEKATENIAVRGQVNLTVEQIRDVIKSDPFFSTDESDNG